MALFVVLPRTDAARTTVRAKVEAEFPKDNLFMDSGAWLISSPGTTFELATRLGIMAEKGPSVIVFAITSYNGRAPAPVWEWLKAKMESASGG